MQRPKLTSTCAKARTRWVFSFFQFFTRSFTAIVQGIRPCPHVIFSTFQCSFCNPNPCFSIHVRLINGFIMKKLLEFDEIRTIWRACFWCSLDKLQDYGDRLLKVCFDIIKTFFSASHWEFGGLLLAWARWRSHFGGMVQWISFFCCRFQRACLIFMASSLSPSRFIVYF